MSAILQNWSGAFTDGTVAPDHFHNGVGFEADGSLAVDIDGVIDHHSQGLPFTASGRLAVSTGAVDHAGSGSAQFTATGHLAVVTSGTTSTAAHGVLYVGGATGIGSIGYSPPQPPSSKGFEDSFVDAGAPIALNGRLPDTSGANPWEQGWREGVQFAHSIFTSGQVQANQETTDTHCCSVIDAGTATGLYTLNFNFSVATPVRPLNFISRYAPDGSQWRVECAANLWVFTTGAQGSGSTSRGSVYTGSSPNTGEAAVATVTLDEVADTAHFTYRGASLDVDGLGINVAETRVGFASQSNSISLNNELRITSASQVPA